MLWKVAAFALATLPLAAQSPQPAPPISLTIYNQNFAVVRTTLGLDVKAGISDVTTTQVTSQLEPDSVVLRDPTGKQAIAVQEQNYDAAIVNQDWLLEKYEGQTIDFQTGSDTDEQHGETPVIVRGKILRASPPLVEVSGKMQFQLPGTPLFPASTDGLMLKPTLRWQIASDRAANFPAELSYVTGGFIWSATYNLVAGEGIASSTVEPMALIGWITMRNSSGVDFPAAQIQLMAGDVAKIKPVVSGSIVTGSGAGYGGGVYRADRPAVTQQNLDDFHLYDLNRTTALRNGETKQVEFLEASAIPVTRSYEFDGAPQFRYYYSGNPIIGDPGYGLDSSSRVTVTNEFVNSQANHLGVPLPAGRMRLYRRDKAGAMQFVGEAEVVHTPRNEKVRFVSGAAFDVIGKRTQTNYKIDTTGRTADESFSIEVKNRKDQPLDVTVVEHLYRAANWQIAQKSTDYTKRDSGTIAFPVKLKADSTTTLTYTVHYTW